MGRFVVPQAFAIQNKMLCDPSLYIYIYIYIYATLGKFKVCLKFIELA